MAGSNTIAFSTKTMNWTTEYSFSPDRFAYVGNQLVSFPRGTSSPAWLHDKNPEYNTFYGNLYPSELQIVTNEDPSATKIYEAFSLEATIGDWSAEFRTRTGELQESSFASGSLVEKEGKHYIDIPKNSLNKDVVIKYVGRATLGDIRNADGGGNIALQKRVNSVPNSYLFFVFPSYSSVNDEGEVQVDGQSFVDDGNAIDELLNYTAILNQSESILGVPLAYKSNQLGAPFSSSLVPINDFVPEFADNFPQGIAPSYDPSTNSVVVNFRFNWESANASSLNIPDGQLSSMPVDIYTGSLSTELNGEDMRGEYMEIKISRTGTDYYELYAINVDQHKTKLDHSLGQNN